MSIRDEKTILWLVLLVLALLTYWPVFSSGRLPGGELSDTVAQGYPFFSYISSRLADGELPLWNPYILCGIPFYESFSAPVFYPLRGIPMILFGPEAAIRFLFPVHLLLAGFFAWLFLKSMGTERWGALVGAVAYASGAWANTLFYAGHGSKIICWAWFPLVLCSVVRFVRSGNPRWIAAGGAAFGMQGLSSHPQMVLYTAGSALILSLFYLKRPLKALLRPIYGFGAMIALGGAVAAVQLYPGFVFSKYSSRGNDLSLAAASSYSLPPEETLTMAFPGMFGLRHGFSDSSLNGIPLYFGRLGLRLSSEFAGVAFLILALLGLTGGGSKRPRYALAAMCLGGMAVSWGGYTPVFNVLYAIAPVFRKLRAPHMAAFVTTSALALAAGPGFSRVFASGDNASKMKRTAMILASIAGLMLILSVVSPGISNALQGSWWTQHGVSDTSPYSAVVSRRAEMLEKDLLRAFAVTAAFSFLVLVRGRGRLKTGVAAGAVLIVGALELLPFNRSFQVFLPQTSIDQLHPDAPELRRMAGSGRIFPGGNEFVPLGIRSVTGYHAAGTAETEMLARLLHSGNPWVLRQTGMTLLVTQQGAAPWEVIQPLLAESASGFPEEPMPRAFIPVSSMDGSREDGFRAMENGEDPQLVSIVENAPFLYDGLIGSAAIILDDPEHITIETETDGEGFLILADTWYPRWTVTVNGAPAPLLRANGWMRAVELPAGQSTVEFRYGNGHIRTGLMISLAGLAAAAALFFAGKGRDA